MASHRKSSREATLCGAETIEAAAPESVRSIGALSGSGTPAPAPQRVVLVQGSAPHLSGETRPLLRRRLRLLALVLFAGFLAFLGWALLRTPLGSMPLIRATHLGVTLLLGLIAWRLSEKCAFALPRLRGVEMLVVGAPALFFVLVNYEKLLHSAEHPPSGGHLPNTAGPWIVLIFSYALFVPNDWRRAAAVFAALGGAPLLVAAAAAYRSPDVARLCRAEALGGVLSEEALMLGLTVLSATVGVRSINNLRREAFVARQLGQYRLKRTLGSGGMGEVYLAEHQLMKRPCAIKVIRPEKASEPQVLARFEREVRATAKLSHWNSIDIFDYGRTEDGAFYYVMEYLPGHNLGELVELHGPLPAERIVHLMRQVCDALAEAHGIGLIHRDLKPANIFAAHRGGLFDVAKLLDFGLAKPLADTAAVDLTQEGTIAGSPLYMSPEQAIGSDALDARSDIYSLGAVMYFMATGRPPFAYSQPLKVLVAHASEQPVPPRAAVVDLPETLEAIILRSLEKRPEDRYQNVADLREALEQVPLSDPWTSELAAGWWRDFGCPQRKALAAEALGVAVAS